MYIKVDSSPVSNDLNVHLMNAYPQTAERIRAGTLPTFKGVWQNGTENDGSWQVVRAIVADGRTLWSLEQWTKNNGYHCKVELLTKAEFLSIITK